MLRPALVIAALILMAALTVRYKVSGSFAFSEITLAIKSRFVEVSQSVDERVEERVNQAETIERLRAENAKLREDSEILTALAAEVLVISKLKNYEPPIGFKVLMVRAISYAELPDLRRIIIDYGGLKSNEIKGLIYNGQTAGIVVGQVGSYAKALLNGDSDCAYAVYVGKANAPGVAMGYQSGAEIIVRYIPQWMIVKEGDEVVTNGLDGIFFAGVKVGVVTKVNRLSAYTEAVVQPYYQAANPDYFYIIESVR